MLLDVIYELSTLMHVIGVARGAHAPQRAEKKNGGVIIRGGVSCNCTPRQSKKPIF